MLVSLYEPDATLVIGGGPVVGRENIGHAFRGLVSGVSQMSVTTRSVFESAGGLALLHGEWIVQRNPPDDSSTTRGISAEVVRRQPDGGWLFVLDNPYVPVIQR